MEKKKKNQKSASSRSKGGESHSVRLNISMPRTDHDALVEKARVAGVPLSRLLTTSALSNELLRAFPTSQVIPWQGRKIAEEFLNECDVWVFGGAGPRLPFTEQETPSEDPDNLKNIWHQRAEVGIHHHVFWDIDLADSELMKSFVKSTVEVALRNAAQSYPGKIFHHGVTVGKLYPDKVESYLTLIDRVKHEGLASSLTIHPLLDICELLTSNVEKNRSAAREARWLSRFGEVGSLVGVLPRRLGKYTSASVLFRSLSIHPDEKPSEIWLWMDKAEASKLADHAEGFLSCTQRKPESNA